MCVGVGGGRRITGRHNKTEAQSSFPPASYCRSRHPGAGSKGRRRRFTRKKKEKSPLQKLTTGAAAALQGSETRAGEAC